MPRELTDLEWERWKGRLRDIIFVILGIALLVNEVFFRSSPNAQVIVAAFGLLGLGPVLSTTRRG